MMICSTVSATARRKLPSSAFWMASISAILSSVIGFSSVAGEASQLHPSRPVPMATSSPRRACVGLVAGRSDAPLAPISTITADANRRFTSVLQGRTMITYFSTRCGDCALKSRCTPAKERRVRRWKHEAVIDAMLARLEHASEAMTVRRRTVEHPLRDAQGVDGGDFLTKGLERVRTEMSL